MYFSVMFFFCYQAPNSVGSHSGQFIVYICLTRIQFDYDCKHIEIGGAGGAIYLPNLVPHHSAWSTHKGR